jgi:hypothetical protein
MLILEGAQTKCEIKFAYLAPLVKPGVRGTPTKSRGVIIDCQKKIESLLRNVHIGQEK